MAYAKRKCEYENVKALVHIYYDFIISFDDNIRQYAKVMQ